MKYRTRSFTGGSALLYLVAVAAAACPSLGNTTPKDYAPFPKPDAGYVTDLADLLSDDQEQQLEDWLLKTETGSGVEIVVVTIRSVTDYPGTPNNSIDAFARALFDAYGVGNMPKNNGVLLLVATQDRKARIELGAGYGHTRDSDTIRIMDRKIVPCFRDGKYAEGIMKGTKALMWRFGGVMLIPSWVKWAIVGAIVGSIPLAISLFRNGKRGWGWVVAGLIIVLVLALVWLVRNTIRVASENGLLPGGRGGFGGGFSGGGGATGSW